MKQTAVEWLENKVWELDNENFTVPNRLMEIISYAKEMEEKQQGYSEEELLVFGKSCFYKGFEKAEKDDANCYTAFREEIGSLIEQFKNK